MKKLMVILGAVVLAAGVQAATVNWSTGKFELPNANGSGFSGSTLSAATDGAYLATIYFFTDSACKTAVEGVTGTTDSTSTKTGKAFNNTTRFIYRWIDVLHLPDPSRQHIQSRAEVGGRVVHG